MKIRITMKTPDVLQDAIDNAVFITEANQGGDEMSSAEVEHVRSSATLKARKWFKYGEYLTVELDTESGTCVVMPV